MRPYRLPLAVFGWIGGRSPASPLHFSPAGGENFGRPASVLKGVGAVLIRKAVA